MNLFSLESVVFRSQDLLVAFHLQGKGGQESCVLESESRSAQDLKLKIVSLDLAEQEVEGLLVELIKVANGV